MGRKQLPLKKVLNILKLAAHSFCGIDLHGRMSDDVLVALHAGQPGAGLIGSPPRAPNAKPFSSGP